MKALIIEDEFAAATALQALIAEVAPDMEILGVVQSVDEAVEWFAANPMPSLVFMDIHLADGSSFSIFEKTSISCPIIFTTAYDQYALKAFDVNSVDYLLKPVSKEHLERAIGKLRAFTSAEDMTEHNSVLVENLLATIKEAAPSYKSSLLIARKDKLVPLAVKSIAYIYTENKVVTAVDFEGRETVLDMNLEEVMKQLDPRRFYRSNRQYIVNREAVEDISVWFNGRLAVNLSVRTPEKVFVSRDNAREFKEWMAG